MQTLSFSLRANRLGLVVVSLALASSGAAPDALGGEPPLLVRLGDPVACGAVHRSLEWAIDRLQRSESCRAVLDEFMTASGQPLSAVLAARGETPGQYLAGLLLLDGTSHPRCRSGTVFAYTAPGWRVVYVCSAIFRRHLAQRGAEAEAVLIHEALHTLGLAENPPSSREIQARVHERCIRGRAGMGSSRRVAAR